MTDVRSYRLSSMEEPTDEQLQALMRQVGEAARESSRQAQQVMDRKLQEVWNTWAQENA